MASRRVLRVAQMVKQEVSNIILFELKDPRVHSVTVTNVEMPVDLRSAKVFVSIMGGERDIKVVLNSLNHACKHIQNVVSRNLELRYVPAIQFIEDESIKKSIRISNLIKKALEK